MNLKISPRLGAYVAAGLMALSAGAKAAPSPLISPEPTAYAAVQDPVPDNATVIDKTPIIPEHQFSNQGVYKSLQSITQKWIAEQPKDPKDKAGLVAWLKSAPDAADYKAELKKNNAGNFAIAFDVYDAMSKQIQRDFYDVVKLEAKNNDNVTGYHMSIYYRDNYDRNWINSPKLTKAVSTKIFDNTTSSQQALGFAAGFQGWTFFKLVQDTPSVWFANTLDYDVPKEVTQALAETRLNKSAVFTAIWITDSIKRGEMDLNLMKEYGSRLHGNKRFTGNLEADYQGLYKVFSEQSRPTLKALFSVKDANPPPALTLINSN